MDRKRQRNKFRYYPIYQNKIEFRQGGRGLITDFKNVKVIPSSYRYKKSLEMANIMARRQVTDIEVITRQPDFKVELGDRIFYPYRKEVLRIDTVVDPTNRGEYFVLNCAKGTFTNRGTVQPNTKMAVKMLADDAEELIESINALDVSNISTLKNIGHFDLYESPDDLRFIRGVEQGSNLYFLIDTSEVDNFKEHFQDSIVVPNFESDVYTLLQIKENFENFI